MLLLISTGKGTAKFWIMQIETSFQGNRIKICNY